MRYDLAPVPFMLGASLLVLGRPLPWRALLAGALCGLATLLQFYGIFMLPIVLVFLWLEPLERRARLKLTAAAVVSAAVVLIPYAAWALSNYDDFKGQVGTIDNRADFSDPGFYVENLLDEPNRFLRPLAFREVPRGEDPDTTDARWLSLQETLTRRPSAKIAILIALPATLVFLAYRAFRQQDRVSRLLFLALGGLAAQFALLDQTKFFIYWIPVVPFLCIGIASLAWWALARAGRNRATLVVSAGVAAVLLLFAAEGSVARLSGLRTAQDATSYARLTQDVHASVPPGSRVVGSTSLWWGLRDTDYRSYFLFFYLTRPDAGSYRTTVSGFLDGFEPDYLVLTELAWEELEEHLVRSDYEELVRYLDDNASLEKVLRGPEYDTYGFVEVWRFR
jgi:hypothetical protein